MKTRPAIAPLLAVALSLLVVPPSQAWNHTGHRVAALIAWNGMTPAAREAATRILKAHPRYAPDLLRDMPDDYAMPEKWAFLTAATWPDIIKEPNHPMRREHHKDRWHYVNLAYAPDGDRRGFVDGTPHRRPGAEPDNILQAIPKVTTDLTDAGATPSGKAIALCWYLHLVGDLHQPLHATSRVSPEFPEGDRGGSIALVKHAGRVTTLHAFWDDRLGAYVLPSLVERVAGRAMQEHPRDAFGDAALPSTPVKLAEESRALAIPFAYLDGTLKAVQSARNRRIPADSVPDLPPGYDESSTAIARRRVAQAGYRMADELNRLLDPAHEPRGVAPARGTAGERPKPPEPPEHAHTTPSR